VQTQRSIGYRTQRALSKYGGPLTLDIMSSRPDKSRMSLLAFFSWSKDSHWEGREGVWGITLFWLVERGTWNVVALKMREERSCPENQNRHYVFVKTKSQCNQPLEDSLFCKFLLDSMQDTILILSQTLLAPLHRVCVLWGSLKSTLKPWWGLESIGLGGRNHIICSVSSSGSFLVKTSPQFF